MSLCFGDGRTNLKPTFSSRFFVILDLIGCILETAVEVVVQKAICCLVAG